MSIPALIIALFITLAVVFWVTQALLEPKHQPDDSASNLDLLTTDSQARSQQLLDDLELDHAVGRLSEEEFDAARAELNDTIKAKNSSLQDY